MCVSTAIAKKPLIAAGLTNQGSAAGMIVIWTAAVDDSATRTEVPAASD